MIAKYIFNYIIDLTIKQLYFNTIIFYISDLIFAKLTKKNDLIISILIA